MDDLYQIIQEGEKLFSMCEYENALKILKIAYENGD